MNLWCCRIGIFQCLSHGLPKKVIQLQSFLASPRERRESVSTPRVGRFTSLNDFNASVCNSNTPKFTLFTSFSCLLHQKSSKNQVDIRLKPCDLLSILFSSLCGAIKNSKLMSAYQQDTKVLFYKPCKASVMQRAKKSDFINQARHDLTIEDVF